MTDATNTLHALLDAYLRCPVEAARTELEQALRGYQTDWIRARAGADAPPLPVAAAPAPAAKPAVAKPRFPIAAADLEVLKRLADGWTGTTAEVSRWAWFENRELVALDPNPAGEGPEVLRLTPLGWAAIGRRPAG
ncbi:hypothetical protein VH569_20600 [Azospirillum sp. 11R-A]|uniref:hypothetical protein n=1 Tax=Azospirillum sp. 11R-A TaxID=3111634 RepID=UPI003C200129